MIHRRGFLSSIGAAVMAVALDVLPTFSRFDEYEGQQELTVIVTKIDHRTKTITVEAADGRPLAEYPMGLNHVGFWRPGDFIDIYRG